MSDSPSANQEWERPTLLDLQHNCAPFDCGSVSLNDYLKKYAFANQRAGAARTYVAVRGIEVVGYYTLAFSSLRCEEATPRVRKGLARHPVPAMLLARLAVDVREHGKGLGRALLKDALLRTLQASEIAGLRAVIVHAKDANAKSFYEQFGFEPSPLEPFHLMLLIKDISKIVSG